MHFTEQWLADEEKYPKLFTDVFYCSDKISLRLKTKT